MVLQFLPWSIHAHAPRNCETRIAYSLAPSRKIGEPHTIVLRHNVWSRLISGCAVTGATSRLRAAVRTRRRCKGSAEHMLVTAALDHEVTAGGTPLLRPYTPSGFDPARETPSGFDPACELGVTAPLGFFDPLGFTNVEVGASTKSYFRNIRASEIKHARVAMLAVAGLFIQHYMRFPGFEHVPNGIAALSVSPGNVGFFFLHTAMFGPELLAWTESSVGPEPGNFGDPLKIGMYSNEIRNVELNQGRLAMIAVTGIFAADLGTGLDVVEQIQATSALTPEKWRLLVERTLPYISNIS